MASTGELVNVALWGILGYVAYRAVSAIRRESPGGLPDGTERWSNLVILDVQENYAEVAAQHVGPSGERVYWVGLGDGKAVRFWLGGQTISVYDDEVAVIYKATVHFGSTRLSESIGPGQDRVAFAVWSGDRELAKTWL